MTQPLDRREAEREIAQQALDQQKPATERNRLGQFATPPALALDMARLAQRYLPAAGGVSFLDPGVGSGGLFYAARKTLGGRRLQSALGFEIDPGVAAEANKLWSDFGLEIRAQDFSAADPPSDERRKKDLILCNPPYVRHHHLSAGQKATLRDRAKRLGFRVSGLAGLYGYFLLLAHGWLAKGGVGVWVVPAEFLDVNYGQALKEYLATRVTLHRIHRFDPEDVQFADALVSSVVVAFANAPPPAGHEVQLTSGNSLSEPHVTHAIPLTQLRPESKWGPRFSSPAGRAVARGALTIGDLFRVRRGLATGANEFFILEQSQARTLGLPDAFLRPILPSPRHVLGACIDRAQDGFPAGLPKLVLLDCDLPIEQVRKRHAALAAYLREGESQGIPQRYLPAHRPLWYRQEQRPPVPILCTYMGRQNGGRAIRFLRNRSDATAANVYLLLYPRPTLAAEGRRAPEVFDRLFGALNEAAAGLPHGGRVYGGGLNKIEPKELEAIELPGWVRERYGHLRSEQSNPGKSTPTIYHVSQIVDVPFPLHPG
ncbi:MAG: N-6 DNA methylase [Gemmataceae bacterium]|nr:N-6 DNA methylase [Gemmataceae bacterium]